MKDSKIQAVVFDMDGVLLDTESITKICWKNAASEYGIRGIEEVHKLCVGTNWNDTLTILKNNYGNNFDAESFRSRCSTLFKEYCSKNGIPLMEGAKSCLEYLKNQGYRIALASSTAYQNVKRELENAQLFHYFETVTTGDMVEHSKPEPDIYLKACKSLHIKPEHCVAIEDSPNGIKSAYKAKMKCVMIPDLIEPTDEIKSIVWKLCNSLNALKDFL
ncbi:MAG: HAD family phosphatase [Treponema sp.]|nr:HAD family phosphatase [Treponema sp.]